MTAFSRGNSRSSPNRESDHTISPKLELAHICSTSQHQRYHHSDRYDAYDLGTLGILTDRKNSSTFPNDHVQMSRSILNTSNCVHSPSLLKITIPSASSLIILVAWDICSPRRNHPNPNLILIVRVSVGGETRVHFPAIHLQSASGTGRNSNFRIWFVSGSYLVRIAIPRGHASQIRTEYTTYFEKRKPISYRYTRWKK